MIQLTAIIGGQHATMLTPEPIAEAARSCRDRFGDRFQGFAPISAETLARAKWSEFKAGDVSRQDLDLWLKGQDDEQEIRACFNKLRG